mmetsp:Transcript_2095/g.5153  ORF Transcript_2095/g.5153 Transcript_2095/m.5153 type:complete len:268 (+) Transcript_2095:495-1298(+)
MIQILIARMRHQRHGVVIAPAKERDGAARQEEEANAPESPPHAHAVLVHGREHEDGEPSHDLSEEGDESHDLCLLSLGDEGHGQRALAGEHPPERDPYESGVKVHEVLVLLGRSRDRNGDEAIHDCEHDLGAPEGVEGIHENAHFLGNERPRDIEEEHDQRHHGDLHDTHLHEDRQEGHCDGEDCSRSGLGGEQQGDHEPFQGLVFLENVLRRDGDLFEPGGKDIAPLGYFPQLGTLAEQEDPRVSEEDDAEPGGEAGANLGRSDVV